MSRPYALVTVAYNEFSRLALAIESVLRQTHPPLRWVIVSDGSTDGTDEIIKSYSRRYEFIQYGRQEKRKEDAGRLEKVTIAQARAMALARAHLDDIPYEFIGNLDADITLVPEYYEKVIAKLEEDPSLGIAGGGVFSMNADGSLMEGGFIKPEFVGGPVQLFRRQCLEDIGGYSPYGHADSVAVAKAQMKGWKVRCFPDISAFHHELPRTTVREKVPDCYRMGQMDYIMGALLVFELARCLARVFKRPYGIAGASMFIGYSAAFIGGREKTVPKDIRRYMQKGQIRKMKLAFKPGKGSSA